MTRARDLAAFVSNADGDIKFDTDTLFIDSSANRVGIGETAPERVLHIKSADNIIGLIESTDADAWLAFQDNTSASNNAVRVGATGDNLRFYAGAAERMRINSDGDVGIGTNNPQYGRLHIADGNSDIAMGSNGEGQLHIDGNGYGFGIALNADGAQIYTNTASRDLIFGVNETEIMRVTDGELVVGDNAEIRGSGQDGVSVEPEGRIYLSRGTGTGGFSHLVFYNGNGQVGSVTTSGSSTAYNTSSDYRLKENVTDVTDGITRVKQLSPKRFNFIADADKVVDGFLAHEAATVVPEAVTGTHNEVDDDGNAVMQGIDQSKLVPLLTAALQEAITKIETLETKVAALEA